MKPVASTSQPVYWECYGQALYIRTDIVPPLPFQFLYLPIGPYYGRFSHRLLTYLLIAACLTSGALLALGITGQAAFILQRLPLACTLALYLAVVFTSSHVLSDLAANHLWPRRMSYGSRNVGRQCVVLFIGLALGFWVHEKVFPDLMQLCAQSSASQLPTCLSLVPLLCAALYACVFMVPMSQHGPERNDAARPGNRVHPAPPALQKAEVPQQPPARRALPATVSFRVDGRQVTIPSKTISHVSMEDHYCRVFYQNGQGLQDLLVREALKGLVSRVGLEDFLQIHRSHLVNKRHIAAYKRNGRKHWLIMAPGGVPLPISRRRQTAVKDALAVARG